MDVYVEQLHAALADALRRSRQRPFTEPVTVAEIYQDLVPYRVVRSRIGFEMNADYEHALLLMLAGVGGLAQLEPETAAAELREELNTPNPNVGLFRKFAACDVWITPIDEAEDVAAERADPEPAAREHTEAESADVQAVPETAPRATADDVDVATRDTTPVARMEPAPQAYHPDAGAATVRRCGFCDAKLPAGRLVRFCPQCGGDQTRMPCIACGEALEREWRYCVACGAAQRDGGAA